MEKLELEKLQYPIGKFEAPDNYTNAYILSKIEEIESFPERLKKEVQSLNNDQLDTPYRENGWTIRQVIHHCAESHMNCYIRIKWTLTEENPVIKYYHEDLWSALEDSLTMPIEPTLTLLDGLHYRLTYILKNLSQTDLKKYFIHPENNKNFELREVIGNYAWHGNHHLAHIIHLKNKKNW